MSHTNKFDPGDLDPNVLNEALLSLLDYYIAKRRLRIRETTLGVGGFGTVKLADLSPNTWFPFGSTPTTVAVKELRTEDYNGVPLRTAIRFARVIKVWASCKHENILQFTGYYLSKDFRDAYLISPYMANGNIRDYLSQKAPPQTRRLELVLDTIKGLAYLHLRDPPIVHGDLKSLNVLVTDVGKAQLCDLGFAKAMEDKSTGLSTSTIRYTSPEVLNRSPRDFSSDIWAWGCLTLEIITGNLPYHECQNETQVVILICGPEDHRKTPEPSDTSSLPSTVLELLRMCWDFEPGRRPDALQCVDKVETICQPPMLLNLSLPEHLFTLSTKLNLSVGSEDWNDLVYGVSIARLSLRDTDEVVMVKCFDISFRPFLQEVADEFNRRWALKHENLLELTGYSIDLGLERFYVISPYMGQTVLLEYLRRSQHLALGARLNLLQDMLKGLVYLHSSAVNVVHGALNPWTVVVNSEGKGVLPLIGSGTEVGLVRNAGLLELPTDLWLGPEQRPTTSWIGSRSDIWSWACIVLQVICESRQYNGISIHIPEFMDSTEFRQKPEPDPMPILPGRLLGLVRKCWNPDPEERPSASDCLDVLDLVIQENSESASSKKPYEPWDDIQFSDNGVVATSSGSMSGAMLGIPGAASDTSAIAPWMLDDPVAVDSVQPAPPLKSVLSKSTMSEASMTSLSTQQLAPRFLSRPRGGPDAPYSHNLAANGVNGTPSVVPSNLGDAWHSSSTTLLIRKQGSPEGTDPYNGSGSTGNVKYGKKTLRDRGKDFGRLLKRKTTKVEQAKPEGSDGTYGIGYAEYEKLWTSSDAYGGGESIGSGYAKDGLGKNTFAGSRKDSWPDEDLTTRRSSDALCSSRAPRTPLPAFQLRVYRIDGSYHIVECPISTIASDLARVLQRKLWLPKDYKVYIRERGLERVLGPQEKPIDILRRRLEQAGYDESDDLEHLGSEDISFLLQFVFRDANLPFNQPTDDDDVLSSNNASFEHIDLTGRGLFTIPILLYRHAPTIVVLNLSKNPDIDIPIGFISSCTVLRDLRLSQAAMTQVPSRVRHISTLHELDISSNWMVSLDKADLHQIPMLRNIQVQNNRLSTLPESFAEMKALKFLNISNNEFDIVPPVLSQITSLVDLDLSFNTISMFPPTLGELTNMERLVIVGNRIASIPPEIANMSRLKEFDCRRNAITDLSPMFKCPALEILRAGNNAVHGVK